MGRAAVRKAHGFDTGQGERLPAAPAMSFSQNLIFSAKTPASRQREQHPVGEHIAQALLNAMKNGGWDCGAIDNWRDCGWCFDASGGSDESCDGHPFLHLRAASRNRPSLEMGRATVPHFESSAGTGNRAATTSLIWPVVVLAGDGSSSRLELRSDPKTVRTSRSSESARSLGGRCRLDT